MRFYNEFHAERRIASWKQIPFCPLQIKPKCMLILIYNDVLPFGDCCQQVGKNIIRFISVSNLKITVYGWRWTKKVMNLFFCYYRESCVWPHLHKSYTVRFSRKENETVSWIFTPPPLFSLFFSLSFLIKQFHPPSCTPSLFLSLATHAHLE